mmetsp:Transcript_10925/g.20045  ORF Transcript_10925/g.20045 Transcript_10925/m.20045 type:complete len:461 (+) Transcript_10925:378-1760(+)
MCRTYGLYVCTDLAFHKPLLDLLARVGCVSEKHIGIFLVEHRVIDTSVSGSHRSFHEDDVARFPDLNDRHTGDSAVWIIFRCAVDSVVGSNNHSDIGVRHLVVDLLHLEHDIIWDSSLCKKHVQLARHTSGNRVDGEFDGFACVGKKLSDVGNRLLRLCNGETVAGYDADAVRVLEGRYGARDVDLGVDEAFIRSNNTPSSSKSSKDDIRQRTVHTIAHDFGQKRTRRPDQSPNDGQQRLVKNETFGTQSPARVRVEQRDDDGHIGPANRRGHVEAQQPAEAYAASEARAGGLGVVGGHEAHHARRRARPHRHVHHVAAGEAERGRGHLFGQLGAGDDRARAGDGAHPRSEVDRRGVEAAVAQPVDHVVAHGGRGGGDADQRVEARHRLGEGGGAYSRGDLLPGEAADGSHQSALGVDGGGGVHREESGGETHRDAAHGQEVRQARGGLVRHRRDSSDAA